MERAPSREVLKIETIHGPRGALATFAPERGGIITSLKLLGKDILYMDPETLTDRRQNVRGGIPILFPNAGPISSPLYPDLPQHGFARNAAWRGERDEQSFTEELHSDAETLKQFPYKFILQMRGILEEKKFTLMQTILNAETDKDMPLSMGLHPYFPVTRSQKTHIKFDFPGGEVLEEKKGEWMQGMAVSIDNPKRHALNADMPVEIPGLGRIVLNASDEYKKIIVWSPPDMDTVCIEPWMRDPKGLVDDPYYVGTQAPNNMLSAKFSIALDK